MKGTAIASALLAGCTLLSCSSSKKVADEQPAAQFKTATVKSITVDGNDADWQGLPTATSPAYTFIYSVARNDKALYLLLRMDNPIEQTKFLRGGMEVWVDPSGKKSKTAEVIFPVKGELSETDMRPQNASTDQKLNREMMHLNIKAALVSLNRIGFKPEYSGVQTISQPTGFKGAINWTADNELVYELEIPLQAFQTPLQKDSFDIGFFIGSVERTNNTSTAGSGEGAAGWSANGSGMGRGGMRGGRGGQGRGASGSGERQGGNTDWKKMTEKENFWVQCSQ